MTKNIIVTAIVALVVSLGVVSLQAPTESNLGGLTVVNTETHTQDLNVIGVGTSTLRLQSATSNRGGCIEFNATSSQKLRAYATTSGPLIVSFGSCE